VSIDVEFSDFGLARMTESNFRSLFCVRIAAPELKQTGKPTEKSDVFALGILLWECLKRAEVNSSSQNGSELFRAGLADAVRTASGDEQLTALLRCIEDCVSPDPNVRPTAFDISERMKAVGAVQKAPTAFTASPLVAWDFHREMWLSKRRLPEADTDAQMNSMPDRRRRGDPDERDVRSVEPARHWSPADRL
jgi:serine/threonine protein kinase